MAFIVVITTAPKRKIARQIAVELLEKRLAACVQISGGILSLYRWKRKLEISKEYQILIKTQARHFHSLKKLILKKHPYSVPEILSLKVDKGHLPYLKWIVAETLPTSQK